MKSLRIIIDPIQQNYGLLEKYTSKRNWYGSKRWENKNTDTAILQVQSELTDLNTELEAKKTELADVRQEVNELTRYDRLSQLASSQGMKLQKENRKTVSASSDE